MPPPTDGYHSTVFFLSLFVLFLSASDAADTISTNQSLVDGHTLVSSGGVFELGFFAPPGSQNRYLGIWYHGIPDRPIVWIANRDTPLTSSGGALNLTTDGNLVLQNQTGNIIWSTNTSGASANFLAQLIDTGNLILTGRQDKVILWQSFDLPTDTLLPGMKISWNLRTNVERHLTSWKSKSDPSTGEYSYKVDPHGARQMYIWKGNIPANRNGPWIENVFGVPLNISAGFMNLILISNKDETYYTYEIINSSILTRLVMSYTGQGQRFVWVNNEWSLFWKFPMDECDAYAKCGAYGVCVPSSLPLCSCLDGFRPRSPELWTLGDGSGGCERTTALNCRTDGFVTKLGIKLPDTSNATMAGGMSLDGCRQKCVNDCSCTAFSTKGDGSTCFTWAGELKDIRLDSEYGGDLYVRLSASDLGEGPQAKRRVGLIVSITVPLGILTIGILSWFYWKKVQQGPKRRHEAFGSGDTKKSRILCPNERREGRLDDKYELPLFSFSTIATSTNNFSDENKLGEGGFGSVYKGTLPNGAEVAVKRLSRGSGQGIEEFANEIQLIAKVQHKNLVKLLGCCIGDNERMLIYEYMPNKSLDHFLYGSDPNKMKPLDWEDRKRIIEGVAQGLVYLHKYSRLKIIHRDLKASNILLDAEMNPKISDFGIARIFSGNQDQEKTSTVIGTYGYMPPEYAIQGLFSEKSDVFSFGVLLLEIVSGKKNGNFVCVDGTWTLLRYAWECWKAEQITELMDPLIRESCPLHEVTRFAHVGLLCVQESTANRPTMSSVVYLLSSGTEALPTPRNLAFTSGTSPTDTDSSSSRLVCWSSNRLTVTAIDPR